MHPDDIQTFFNTAEFAVTIQYNGADILAIETDSFFADTGIPGISAPRRGIMVKESDVPQPRPGDQVTIDAAPWHVVPGSFLDGGVWTLNLQRETLQYTVAA